MSKLLQKNVELWAHFYPQEAVMLPYLDNRGYSLEKGQLKGPKGLYEMGSGAKWFAQLDLKDETVLVVYGIGLGEHFDPIEKWLNKEEKRRVFFFEEDPHILAKLFETPRATEMLSHPQVEIHWLKELNERDPALAKFFWSAALQKAYVAISPPYQKWFPERVAEFEHQILFTLDQKNGLIEEYLKYGISFFRSFYYNMLDLSKSYLGNRLFGKFKGVPAIICGAGPSLEKQIPLLKTLKDKAFIVAGGSSLNALSYAGLLPHFSCGLDPNAEQAVRLRTNRAKGVPFFYRNRMHVEAFRLISGPRLYVTGSGGYDISDYYEKALGIEDEFIDEGHNVINFLCEITTRLGCDPIIFVGLDLAFTDHKIYAKGVVEKESFTAKNIPPEIMQRAVQKKDWQGNPIWTEWKWVGEALWISKFAKEHPANTFINCTEGGLAIKGIEHLPFAEVAKSTLVKKRNLTARFAKALVGAKEKTITRAKLKKLTQDLAKSLERVLTHLQVMDEDTLRRLADNPLAPPAGATALAETELTEEPGYLYVLNIFNIVYAHLQNQPLRHLRLNEGKLSPQEIEREKLRLQHERLTFLKDTAKLNLKLIDLALNIKK